MAQRGTHSVQHAIQPHFHLGKDLTLTSHVYLVAVIGTPEAGNLGGQAEPPCLSWPLPGPLPTKQLATWDLHLRAELHSHPSLNKATIALICGCPVASFL